MFFPIGFAYLGILKLDCLDYFDSKRKIKYHR